MQAVNTIFPSAHDFTLFDAIGARHARACVFLSCVIPVNLYHVNTMSLLLGAAWCVRL